MDFYQSIVFEYLRADRALFINTEFCLQKNPVANPDSDKPHWYVDAVAADFRSEQVFLVEITFSKSLQALLKRLVSWREHWPSIKSALVRDAYVPAEWDVCPWLFVPEDLVDGLRSRVLPLTQGPDPQFRLPMPLVTTLEMTQPWLYRSWDRRGKAPKLDFIDETMKK